MLTLVTGATGQIGRRFVPRLLQSAAPGEEVRVLVRDAARGERFAELGAQVLVGDLCDAEVLGKATAGVDAVVNVAAAFRGVPDEEARAVNRDAAIELGRAAVASGVRRFVQVSTGLVYGMGRGRALVESDETVPGGHLWGAYPESKWEAERALGALDGLDDLRIGRLPFVYGDGDSHLASVMEWALNWPAMQRLHMGHHMDVAQGLRRLLYAPGGTRRLQHRRRCPGHHGRPLPVPWPAGAAGGLRQGRPGPVAQRDVDDSHPSRTGLPPSGPVGVDGAGRGSAVTGPRLRAPPKVMLSLRTPPLSPAGRRPINVDVKCVPTTIAHCGGSGKQSSRQKSPSGRGRDGPHDFAGAVARSDQDDCFGRQGFGRAGSTRSEISPQSVGRVSVGQCG